MNTPHASHDCRNGRAGAAGSAIPAPRMRSRATRDRALENGAAVAHAAVVAAGAREELVRLLASRASVCLRESMLSLVVSRVGVVVSRVGVVVSRVGVVVSRVGVDLDVCKHRCRYMLLQSCLR
jgi:hypothetical protein